MSVVAELKASKERKHERRPVLGSSRSRETDRSKQGLSKPQQTSRLPNNNASFDSSCSSDSSSSVKMRSLRRRVKPNGLKSGKVVPDGVDVAALSSSSSVMLKRCEWITLHSVFRDHSESRLTMGISITILKDPLMDLIVQLDGLKQSLPLFSEVVKMDSWGSSLTETLYTSSAILNPIHVSFHDEEWGVPVHDDRKLFELLVLSEALAELSWPAILNKRDIFRKLFDNFDPASVAKVTEKKILELKAIGNMLLSEPKLRAIVENARQILKVQQEFGSFNSYCWSFVNHKPIKNGYRYMRQVPVKTPKAEAMSKDLMQRGFRCVGPTVVYSFMQASGIVNDHLSNCFRYQECDSNVRKVSQTKNLAKELEKTCLSPD